MSYPYTKPQPRFGYRRPWGDPRVGLVGSGPGRPLRTYVTDPEVGLPQRGAGLGESAETPVTAGIFNMGPAAGFNRGVFTPDPPWATPRYIASMRDPVSGVGRFGGFGQDAAADPCGLDKIKSLIVNKITADLAGNIVIKDPIAGLELWRGNLSDSVKSMLRSALDGLQAPALQAIKAGAQQGVSAARTAMTTHITPIITNLLKSVVGDKLAYTVSFFIDNSMKPLYDLVTKEIQKCIGAQPGALMNATQACATMNLQPYSGNGLMIPLIVEGQLHKCEAPQSASQQMLQMQSIIPFNQTMSMSKVDLNKITTADPALLTTLSSAQQRCAADGGEWYPGGADCQVDSSGQLYNCQAPTAYTTKKYSCVPKGTAGAQAITATGVVSSGSKATVPLIIGAAALAALLLTRL